MVTRRALGLLPLGLVALLAVLLLAWAHPVGRDSSVHNHGWNGVSQACAELGAEPLLSYDELDALPLPASLILMPHLPLGDAAADLLDRFTVAGGTLVLLDDFGYGNDLLERLGVDVRLGAGVLLDPLYCHKHESMPRVEFLQHDVDVTRGDMVFNRGTWLDVAGQAGVWAWSSYFSFADGNGDGVRSKGERNGPLPVAVMVPRGEGKVVVVADASLLLNSMLAPGDNVAAVAQWLEGRVLIDQVHLPEAEMDRGQQAIQALRGSLDRGGGAVVLAMLIACCALEYAWYNRGRQDNE